MLNQEIIPAISNYKQLDVFLKSKLEYCIILNFHINHLEDVVGKIKENHKKILIHLDLINGLSSDKYGCEYISQKLKVDGVISTKPNVITTAKQNNILAIQRIFLIDSTSLAKSISLVNKTKPDILEVLPGIAIPIIKQIQSMIDIPLIGGGLIIDEEDLDNIRKLNLLAITTGEMKLWNK